jgi:hypothetical protein
MQHLEVSGAVVLYIDYLFRAAIYNNRPIDGLFVRIAETRKVVPIHAMNAHAGVDRHRGTRQW